MILNFSDFIDQLLDGKKNITLRNSNKRNFKTGTKLEIYTSNGNKKRLKLGDSEVLDVFEVVISADGISFPCNKTGYIKEHFPNIIKADGFKTKAEFLAFYRKNVPDKIPIFKYLIHFRPLHTEQQRAMMAYGDPT